MLVTASPGGVEQVFVSLGVPVTGPDPPADAVMPPVDELVPLFAVYGCEILGLPLSLSDLCLASSSDRLICDGHSDAGP